MRVAFERGGIGVVHDAAHAVPDHRRQRADHVAVAAFELRLAARRERDADYEPDVTDRDAHVYVSR